jgi:hypothetical protein
MDQLGYINWSEVMRKKIEVIINDEEENN